MVGLWTIKFELVHKVDESRQLYRLLQLCDIMQDLKKFIITIILFATRITSNNIKKYVDNNRAGCQKCIMTLIKPATYCFNQFFFKLPDNNYQITNKKPDTGSDQISGASQVDKTEMACHSEIFTEHLYCIICQVLFMTIKHSSVITFSFIMKFNLWYDVLLHQPKKQLHKLLA